MKNLFFVSVALGIFSGTSIYAEAQTAVNLSRLPDGPVEKKSLHFIEGIEITAGTTVSLPTVAPALPKIIVSAGGIISNAESGSSIEKCSALQFKYAEMMNMEIEELNNPALCHVLDDWWGTHYRYGGTGRGGIDCSAWAGRLLNDVYGKTTPRTARAQHAIAEKVDKEDLKEGDLVFFNTRGGVSHVGVYLGNGYFTHASVKNGVTINNLDESYYKARFISGGRICDGYKQ